MKVQAAELDVLQVRTVGWSFLVMGLVFMAVSVFITLAFLAAGAGWLTVLPLIGFLLGAAVIFGFSITETALSRYGQSEMVHRRPLIGVRKEDRFDAHRGQYVGLHTEVRVRHRRTGRGAPSRRTRSRRSQLFIVLEAGREVVLGRAERSGIGGNQPLSR